MNYNVQIGFALCCWNTPLLSRSLDQHESRRCSGLTHCVVERAYRVRPVRILVSVSLVANGLLDSYSLPIRVQFISDNEWQSGAAPRAHLLAMAHHPHRAVRVDP